MVKTHVYYVNNGDSHGFDLGSHAEVKSALSRLRFTRDLSAASRILLPRTARRPSHRVQKAFPNPSQWSREHEFVSHAADAYDWQIVKQGSQRRIKIPPVLQPPPSVPPEILKKIQNFETSLVSEADINRASATLRNRRGAKPPKEPRQAPNENFQLPNTSWGPPFALDPMETAVAGTGPEFYSGLRGRAQPDPPVVAKEDEAFRPLPLPSEVDLARAYTKDEVVTLQQQLFESWVLQVKPLFDVIKSAQEQLPEWQMTTTGPSSFGPFILLVEETLDTILNMMELGAVWKIFLEKHNTGNAFASFGQVDIEPVDDQQIFIKAVERAYLSGSFSNTILLLTKMNAYLTMHAKFCKDQYQNMYKTMKQAYLDSQGTLACKERGEMTQVCLQVTIPGRDEYGANVMGQAMMYTVADLQKMICNRVQTLATVEFGANETKKVNVKMNKRATYELAEQEVKRNMYDMTDSINFVLEHLGKEPVRLAGREDFCEALDNTISMVFDLFQKDYLNVFSKQLPVQPVHSFWLWISNRVPEVELIVKNKMFPTEIKNSKTAFEVYQELRGPLNSSADHVLYAIGVFLSCIAFQMMIFLGVATYHQVSTIINMPESEKTKILDFSGKVSEKKDQAYTTLQSIRAKKRSFERRMWQMLYDQKKMLTDVVGRVSNIGTGVWDTVRELGYYLK